MSKEVYYDVEIEPKYRAPAWFKLYPKELIDATGIREFNLFDNAEKQEAIYAVGAATIEALLYYELKATGEEIDSELYDSRPYKTILSMYKRNIDAAFSDLLRRIRAGGKRDNNK